MNARELGTAAAAGSVLRVLMRRQGEQGAGDEPPLWNVRVFVSDEDDPGMAQGPLLVGSDQATLWFERVDDACRLVRHCGCAHGIRIEGQIVEAEDDDV